MKLSNIGKSKKNSCFFALGSSLVFFISAVYLHKLTPKPTIFVTTQESAINFNTTFLKLGSFGNKRLISDLIWTQTLLQSDVEHYKNKDLNNWMFLRFNTISELDPNFYENYLYGSQFLSVVKDDVEAASILIEKGLSKFPNDYDLNYFGGIMYYFELGNSKRGLELMKKIEHHPRAREYYSSIIHKLELESGINLKTVYQLVLEQYERTQDKYLKKKLEYDLYAIKAEIDLKCLNNNKTGCDQKDAEGNPYRFINGQFHTYKPFNLYRIKKRGEHKAPLNITTIR